MIGYPKSNCFRIFPEPGFPAGLIQTAKQKGRPDNPSGLFPERKCTNACVAAFSGPTTNR
ncbi:hypothetical protein HC237_15080 [Ochrobactrum intermedium]|jgi:hypothetical protein|nr:hypothetical protein F9K78_01515 [Brucella pseudintermedia]NKE76715.1 hypothetical protein [Ochrobactrum sp. MC-1LL]